MDDSRPPAGAESLPADFVPLRLHLIGTNTALELDRPILILGRHSEADIRLPLPDVSRRHCRATFQDGTWHIQDLQSLNGTYINTEPIEDSLLSHGDVLRIGGFSFTVELAPPTILTLDLPATLTERHPGRRAS